VGTRRSRSRVLARCERWSTGFLSRAPRSWAVTLAALAAEGETTIEVPGPTRDHTERLLGWLGAPVRRDGFVTRIAGPTGFAARDIDVPGDISSAAFWLAAAALHPDAELRIRDVGLNPSRLAIVEVLREMGAHIEVRPGAATGPEPVGDLVVRGGHALRGIRIQGPRTADLIDELPMLAVVMAAADGPSEVRDGAELRVKESDRIALVVAGLQAIGVAAQELPDGWRVDPSPARTRPASPTIETRSDHRIAWRSRSPLPRAWQRVPSSMTPDAPRCRTAPSGPTSRTSPTAPWRVRPERWRASDDPPTPPSADLR